MKSIVIYNSDTGFTERYALWIAESIGCEAAAFKAVKSGDFSSYDAVIFGSWFYAGSIRELDWFKKLMNRAPEKKYVVFATGASPLDSPDVAEALKKNIPEKYSGICRAFYCPGGLCYGKMSVVHQMMMKMFTKMVAGKKDKTPDEEIMAEMIGRDYDISDRKYIEPIIEYINALSRQ